MVQVEQSTCAWAGAGSKCWGEGSVEKEMGEMSWLPRWTGLGVSKDEYGGKIMSQGEIILVLLDLSHAGLGCQAEECVYFMTWARENLLKKQKQVIATDMDLV